MSQPLSPQPVSTGTVALSAIAPPAADPARLPPADEAPAPVAGALVETDAAREDRLRGRLWFRRTAGADDIERDLGVYRALDVAYAPFQALCTSISVVAGFGSVGGGLLLSMATQTPIPLLILVPLGVPTLIASLVLRTRMRAIKRAKIDFASSLLRRLDVAPGADVNLQLQVGPTEGTLVTDKTLASSFFTGRSAFEEVYQDAWLQLETTLTSGVRVRIARTMMTLKHITRVTSGNTIRTTTRTSRVFQDVVGVAYDPAQNPRLAAAGKEAANALTLGGDARIQSVEASPGLLQIGVTAGPRASDVNMLSELLHLAARMTELATPGRVSVLEDREAWAPALAAEEAAKKRGAGAHLAFLIPAIKWAIAGVVVLTGLLMCFGGVNLMGRASRRDDSAATAAATIARTKATLAKTKGKAERDALQRSLDALKTEQAEAESEAQTARIQGIVQLVVGPGLVFGAPLGVVLLMRRKKRKGAAGA